MSNELDRLKTSWSNYPKTVDHLIKAQIESERLRALNVLYRLQEIKLGVVGVGGLTAPTFTKEDFTDIKSRVKKSIQSIRRIILAEGAKGVGPYEDLPPELRRNLNVIRYTYRQDVLNKLGKAAQQSTAAESDMVNLYSPENVFSDTVKSSDSFDLLHNDATNSDRRKADSKLSLVPSIEASKLSSPINTAPLQFGFWEPGADSISGTDPAKLKSQFDKINPYTLSTGLAKLRSSGNTGVFTFKMKNLATNQEEIFPAYIRSLTETTSPSWNSMDFPNRSESIYVYQKADRAFTIDFFLIATKFDETVEDNPEQYTIYTTNGPATLDVIGKNDLWRKKNFLQSLNYPLYDQAGKYSRGPYGRIWLADLFVGIPFISEGMTFNYDPLLWDLNSNDVKPTIIQISMSGKFIHPSAPSALTDYHGDFS